MGLGYAWEGAANCLSTSMSSDKLHISTSHEVQWLSIKVLSFVRPYFEGTEPKERWLQREKPRGLDSSQFRMDAYYKFPRLGV